MTSPQRDWPYATVAVMGAATVDPEGENQTCACGNDTMTHDWCSADRDGRVTFAASGSSDPEEFTVCPQCGRVYKNQLLFEAAGAHAAAVARYDVADPEFAADRKRYELEAYGAPTSDDDPRL